MAVERRVRGDICMRKKVYRIAALLIAAILVFTGCGKAGENAGTGAGSTDTVAATQAPAKDTAGTETASQTGEAETKPDVSADEMAAGTETEETENASETEAASDTQDAGTADAAGTEGEATMNTATTLKEAYKDYFMIGTIYSWMNPTGKDFDVITSNFDIITPENLMKPESMQRTEGDFNYDAADKMLAFADENGLIVHGHTLAWHQQSGNWLGKSAANREEAIAQLKAHIEGVAGHYSGRIYSWDVVNEAISDGAVLPADGDWKKCLRQSQWTESIGTDFLELAFQFAHEAAPDAKLYYNDYNLDNRNKAAIVAAMVKDFKERGIPIDGIGMQGHYSTSTSIRSVESNIEMFESIPGITISVSELDVQVSGVSSGKLNDEQAALQAKFYAQLFQVYRAHAASIERVTFWGYRDDTSWRSSSAPLLFDTSLNPKPAYYAVLDPDNYADMEYVAPEHTTKSIKAVYGTPVIDGQIDDLWAQAEKGDIANACFAWQGATGTVRLAWDENYLYALVEVKDPVLNKDNGNAYEQDSVEFFFDPNNCKEMSYDTECGQYRANYEGTLSYGSTPTTEGVSAATSITADGYIVEFAIPFTVDHKAGTVIGFDAQINDASASGTRQSVMKFNGTDDSDYTNPSAWGEAVLQ